MNFLRRPVPGLAACAILDPMPTYDAILPAGGKIDAEFAKVVGTNNKALIRLEGKTILGRTLDALSDTGMVKSTIVIGPEVVRNHPEALSATYRLEPGETGPDNIYLGLNQLLAEPNPPQKVLVVTTDLPFLTAEVIRGFIESCPLDKDICVPLVRASDYRKRFPGTEATFVKLRDDVWTTGCLYVMDVQALRKAKPHIDRVFLNRKSKMGMARMLGPAFVLKWLTKRLTLVDVEAKIMNVLGCSGAAIPDSAPELAFDIDYIEDYYFAVKHIEESQ
jgi:GTP:adenosylcobinamide-phosphate guanylyltransferase